MSLLFKVTLCSLGLALAACGQGRTDATPSRDGRVTIEVGEGGYHPETVRVPAGKPVTLVFKRTTDHTCGTEVVFPSLHLHRDLPLNRPVEITITPASGRVAFTCGMGMYQGAIVAR
jgi:plastocyanin domain-containing protein